MSFVDETVVDVTMLKVALFQQWDWRMRVHKQRSGQALMNTLSDIAPDLHQIIIDDGLDCFHDDTKVMPVIKALGF